MHRIRLAVRENRLSDRTAIDESSYLPFVTDGTAWVAETGADVIGFAAVDTTSNSVWALFVHPEAEGSGAGKALNDRILECARQRELRSLVLTTSKGTRAERFYRDHGWKDAGTSEDGELRFERLL